MLLHYLVNSKHRKCNNIHRYRPITKENCIRCHSFIKDGQVHHALNLLITGVIEHCVYETNIHDIDNLRKRLMQTWFWLWSGHHSSLMLRLTSDMTIWDHKWVHGGEHFEHMFIYMIQLNVLWNCQCNLMYV